MPPRETAKIDPAIDWEADAIWVQNIEMILFEPGADTGRRLAQTQAGAEVRLTPEALAERYVPVEGATVFKPRFHPIQAICPGDETRLATADEVTVVPPGDAIIRHEDGRIEAMTRHRFNCAYRIVGVGEERPGIGPFQ